LRALWISLTPKRCPTGAGLLAGNMPETNELSQNQDRNDGG